ncbi:hypothetical protein D8M04_19835 [Oceanobacillus piezotolerans]|uniref:HTTM-like domain-containing protein n=1 Tax=Oceanobacillus piezotolerans TaxID=2448030 RepID=A0A498D8Q8_9BACI|nr:sporulation-delaying protein SdpB family protein [Oceanobacillus piezotolerans]RLL39808.1 hypothetical protein D8M04_19835 [Oceanobacillus piezotolerans]
MDKKLENWLHNANPWTNVYGLARTLLATSTLLTLLFNPTGNFFKPSSFSETYPNCSNRYSIFCLIDFNDTELIIIKWICILILGIVASGWRPRFTGIFHAWITFSFYNSAVAVDGGEQVATVFSLILLPITLTDNRKWHWQDPPQSRDEISKVIGMTSYYALRVQVAILYFHSVVAKISEEEWIDGTAVWYYIQSPMLGFHPDLLNIFKPLLTTPLIVVPTWGTLILQFILVMALVIDKKYWKYILIAAMFMHEIFAIALGLISFSLAVIAVLLMYLRPLEETFNFKEVKNTVLSNTFKGLNKIKLLKNGRLRYEEK